MYAVEVFVSKDLDLSCLENGNIEPIWDLFLRKISCFRVPCFDLLNDKIRFKPAILKHLM